MRRHLGDLIRAHRVEPVASWEINGGSVVEGETVSGLSVAEWRHPGLGALFRFCRQLGRSVGRWRR